jgi:hypothetical protein
MTVIPSTFLTQTASTKRRPAEASGRVGAMTAHLTSVQCTDLVPVSAEYIDRVPQLAQYAMLYEVLAEDADIEIGDVLVVGSTEYPVRAVERWPWPGSEHYLHLIVEEVQ